MFYCWNSVFKRSVNSDEVMKNEDKSYPSRSTRVFPLAVVVLLEVELSHVKRNIVLKQPITITLWSMLTLDRQVSRCWTAHLKQQQQQQQQQTLTWRCCALRWEEPGRYKKQHDSIDDAERVSVLLRAPETEHGAQFKWPTIGTKRWVAVFWHRGRSDGSWRAPWLAPCSSTCSPASATWRASGRPNRWVLWFRLTVNTRRGHRPRWKSLANVSSG